MTKATILGLVFLLPNLVFSQNSDQQYVLTSSGWFFMIFSWVSIIVWNIICFKKILENKE